jgi:hypothetical protein
MSILTPPVRTTVFFSNSDDFKLKKVNEIALFLTSEAKESQKNLITRA